MTTGHWKCIRTGFCRLTVYSLVNYSRSTPRIAAEKMAVTIRSVVNDLDRLCCREPDRRRRTGFAAEFIPRLELYAPL
jgi:hypothetical protein